MAALYQNRQGRSKSPSSPAAPDPTANVRLRILIQNAKAENMPAENVERAIKRAISKGYVRLQARGWLHEGYGPVPESPCLGGGVGVWHTNRACQRIELQRVRVRSAYRPAPISRS